MYRIAIVEDEDAAVEKLTNMLQLYGKEHGQEFDIIRYKNAVIFLTNYQPNFDMIFMDIQMPHMDGMEAAQKLRKLDTQTLLVFVTNMAQMAIRGYEVEAFDFVVKPLHYDSLALKMDRILKSLARRQDQNLVISSDGARILVSAHDIYYIEVFDHRLVFHTEKGDYSTYGAISKYAEQLEPVGFFQCNKCYLVNLRYVKKVDKYVVTVKNDQLQISHPKKKAFLEALNNYFGG